MNALIALLFMVLLVSALAIFFFKDLLYVVIIFGAYSLVMALIWQQLNAPDIAITEALSARDDRDHDHRSNKSRRRLQRRWRNCLYRIRDCFGPFIIHFCRAEMPLTVRRTMDYHRVWERYVGKGLKRAAAEHGHEHHSRLPRYAFLETTVLFTADGHYADPSRQSKKNSIWLLFFVGG